MRSFSPFFALFVLAHGCAAGEPLDGGPHSDHLAEDDIPSVAGLVYVDVADPAGRPLFADAVWVASDATDATPADCFDLEDSVRCPTWFADFDAHRSVDVIAELCGRTFTDSIFVESMLGTGLAAAQVTVVAQDDGCGTGTPAPSGPPAQR
jgi:hypothetical protein